MTVEWENIVATVTLTAYDDCELLTGSLYGDGRPWVCTVTHEAARSHVVTGPRSSPRRPRLRSDRPHRPARRRGHGSRRR